MIGIYENPETSEVAAEFKTAFEVLKYPARLGAQAIRNGTVLLEERDGRWAGVEAILLEKDEPVLLTPVSGGFEYEDSVGCQAYITAEEATEQVTDFVADGFRRI